MTCKLELWVLLGVLSFCICYIWQPCSLKASQAWEGVCLTLTGTGTPKLVPLRTSAGRRESHLAGPPGLGTTRWLVPAGGRDRRTSLPGRTSVSLDCRVSVMRGHHCRPAVGTWHEGEVHSPHAGLPRARRPSLAHLLFAELSFIETQPQSLIYELPVVAFCYNDSFK